MYLFIESERALCHKPVSCVCVCVIINCIIINLNGVKMIGNITEEANNSYCWRVINQKEIFVLSRVHRMCGNVDDYALKKRVIKIF